MYADNATSVDTEELMAELELMKNMEPHENILNLLGQCTTPGNGLYIHEQITPRHDNSGNTSDRQSNTTPPAQSSHAMAASGSMYRNAVLLHVCS